MFPRNLILRHVLFSQNISKRDLFIMKLSFEIHCKETSQVNGKISAAEILAAGI